MTSLITWSAISSSAEPQIRSAAEIDWVAKSDLSAEDASELPWFCNGMYAPPTLEGIEGDTQMFATSDSALHVVDHSTSLSGNVVVVQGKKRVTAPFITRDAATEITSIEGPLVMREEGLLLTGEKARTNLFAGTGVIDNATFLLHQASLRGTANRLVQDADKKILIDQGEMTRCDPTSNVWKMKGENIELDPDAGWGVAKNVTLKIKDVPVFYFPWFRFPINDKRQSGLLSPSVGYDSDGGTDIVTPYYFNLAPNYDATYQFRSLWKRGFIHDGQLRYKNEYSDNEINGAILAGDDIYDERELFDQTSSGTDTSSVDVPDFEKQNRWLLNLRHEGDWGTRWKTTVNYSAVSDLDYLKDIGGDVGSDSVDRFVGPIDANLTDQRSASLTRLGKVEYRDGRFAASLSVQGFQSLVSDSDEQYEKIPSLTAQYGSDIGAIKYKVDFDYSFFTKDNTDTRGINAIVGERVTSSVKFSIPFRRAWGFVNPSLRVIHRKYNLDDTPLNFRANPEETTPLFSLDSGLYFDRFFDFTGTAFQQTLEPRFYFLYAQEEFQNDLPNFDSNPLGSTFAQLFRENRFGGSDRIGDARQLSVGLTSRFLFQDTGAELLSVSLGQIYYFKDRTVGNSSSSTERESPLFAEARLKLGENFIARSTFEWEPDVNRSNRGEISVKYSDEERRIFNVSYRGSSGQGSLASQSEVSDVTFIWPIINNWSAIGRWNFGWDTHQTLESLIGFEYNDCCWRTRLVARRFIKDQNRITILEDDPSSLTGFKAVDTLVTRADTGIFLEFQLKGLSTLGRRLDSLLELSIPGYRNREDLIGQ
ncbi:LPS assembly protein LptD [Pseudomonadales bacterium]|nr:LPS assembly protein LptD [Pseudomonadales bacterium]